MLRLGQDAPSPGLASPSVELVKGIFKQRGGGPRQTLASFFFSKQEMLNTVQSAVQARS